MKNAEVQRRLEHAPAFLGRQLELQPAKQSDPEVHARHHQPSIAVSGQVHCLPPGDDYAPMPFASGIASWDGSPQV